MELNTLFWYMTEFANNDCYLQITINQQIRSKFGTDSHKSNDFRLNSKWV